jgi:hypothetical protein
MLQLQRQGIHSSVARACRNRSLASVLIRGLAQFPPIGETTDARGRRVSRMYELRSGLAALRPALQGVGNTVAHITGLAGNGTGAAWPEVEVEYSLTTAPGAAARFRQGGGVARGADGEETHFAQLSADGAAVHSAAHGVTFALEARDAPVLVTTLYCSGARRAAPHAALHARAPPCHAPGSSAAPGRARVARPGGRGAASARAGVHRGRARPRRRETGTARPISTG